MESKAKGCTFSSYNEEAQRLMEPKAEGCVPLVYTV